MATSNSVLDGKSPIDLPNTKTQIYTCRDIKIKEKRNKRKSDYTPFVLDCCRLTPKLPKYNSIKDKYLDAYFGKKKRLSRLREVYDDVSSSRCENVSYSRNKHTLPFHQRQMISLSKKLDKNKCKQLCSCDSIKKRSVVLPMIAQSKNNIEKLIKEFESKSKPEHNNIKIVVSHNFPQMRTSKPDKLKPLTKDEFVNTIIRMKKESESKLINSK